MGYVVERGYAVLRVGGNRLAAHLGRFQLAVLGYHQLHFMAYAFSAYGRNLAEQLCHVASRQRYEANLVLERGHVEHVAVGHVALGERRTYATYIIYCEVRPLAVVLATPHQDVGQQV